LAISSFSYQLIQTKKTVITPLDIEHYKRDGAVVLRGVFNEWIDVIAEGIERNMASPGEYASENAVATGEGRFFDDYCNWRRIPEFENVILNSSVAALAAEIMQSSRAQFFHDHVLVKEPGTPKPTPWHQDSPYYFVNGEQTVSFWIPIDAVKTASLRLIQGSHRLPKLVRPVSWADDSDFYDQSQEWMSVPDPDASPDEHTVLEWALQPGDAVLFDFRTVHGARGNALDARRRALSLRWVGDDARYVERGGRTSPPFPGHDMIEGQRLREDWFPVVWNRPED
jgi:ectoine hydroxylase-related dioxygenase (phytanoyl-CoA dioxygenase family)